MPLPPYRTPTALTTLLLPALLATGCASIGPQSISANRPAYNVAVQQTNDQELLLNLVRLLYRDTLYFTSVERIAASMELNRNLSLGGNLSAAPPAANVRGLNLSSGLAVNDRPTVFYAPIEGEKFVRQMMTPMNPELLLMLVKSGWSIDRVLRVGVQEMNGLKNAPTAAGPTPLEAPEFGEFLEATQLLRVLQRDHLLDLAATPDGKGIELRFVRTAKSRPETTRLKQLMGLSPSRARFRIVPGVEAPDNDTIALTTRPLLSALSYVAQGIQAPAQDIAAGKVRQTVGENDQPFDWQKLLGGIFKVQSSAEAPSEASVSVFYRGQHFYIGDNDLETKSTFVLLTQLIALHAVPAAEGPGLSFSFGR